MCRQFSDSSTGTYTKTLSYSHRAQHTKDMAQEGHCWHPTKLLQEWFLQPTTAVGVIGFLFHLQWT